MQKDAICLENPQHLAGYTNNVTSSAISTLPGLATLGGLAIVAAYYCTKVGRIIFAKKYAGSRGDALEAALGDIASKLSLSKADVIDNLPALVLASKPADVASNIRSLP